MGRFYYKMGSYLYYIMDITYCKMRCYIHYRISRFSLQNRYLLLLQNWFLKKYKMGHVFNHKMGTSYKMDRES